MVLIKDDWQMNPTVVIYWQWQYITSANGLESLPHELVLIFLGGAVFGGGAPPLEFTGSGYYEYLHPGEGFSIDFTWLPQELINFSRMGLINGHWRRYSTTEILRELPFVVFKTLQKILLVI